MAFHTVPRFDVLTDLSIQSILLAIVDECEGGCSDEASTFEYFARLKAFNANTGRSTPRNRPITESFSVAEVAYLRAICGSLNFPGIREQQYSLRASISHIDSLKG